MCKSFPFLKSTIIERRWNMILIGGMGTGKDTVAQMIQSKLHIYSFAFADFMKELMDMATIETLSHVMYRLFKATESAGYKYSNNGAKDMYEVLKDFVAWYGDWNEPNQNATKADMRMWYQKVGETGRAFRKDLWADILKVQVSRYSPNDTNKYIIRDCRFINEFEKFPNDISIYIDSPLDVRIERIKKRDSDFDEVWLFHPSELEIPSLKNRADYVIHNDGSLEDLEKQVDNILDDIKKKHGVSHGTV